MIERFITQTHFNSTEDYREHLHFKIPENFNFAYDVMDEWAREKPDKLAMIWTHENGDCRRFTFGDFKVYTDRTAAYFQSLGIGRGDKVMLILKRHYHFWFSILALHKLGAIAIPATHMLTTQDIVYRNNRAGIKAIVCVGDEYVLSQVAASKAGSPTLKYMISVGPIVPEGFHDFEKEWVNVPPFRRPEIANTNDDTMIIYFTSGTSGEPKMVAHNFLYALGHLTTGVFWHNLTEDSIHLTVADTGWGKAVWGKLYGQWFAGAVVFVFEHEKFTAPGIDNRGFVNYYTEMPYVFALSKVNLKITLRSIQKGIPLRCFDILGCGGFLVTNYQEDFNRFFVPGEDYVYYEDRKDLVNKIGWYLREDDRRQAIAESGRRKVLQDHTFDVRVRQILQVLRDA